MSNENKNENTNENIEKVLKEFIALTGNELKELNNALGEMELSLLDCMYQLKKSVTFTHNKIDRMQEMMDQRFEKVISILENLVNNQVDIDQLTKSHEERLKNLEASVFKIRKDLKELKDGTEGI